MRNSKKDFEDDFLTKGIQNLRSKAKFRTLAHASTANSSTPRKNSHQAFEQDLTYSFPTSSTSLLDTSCAGLSSDIIVLSEEKEGRFEGQLSKHLREYKISKEMTTLEVDVQVFHEAKLMFITSNRLIEEAEEYCLLLKDPTHFCLVCPESEPNKFWNNLRHKLRDEGRDTSTIEVLSRSVPLGSAKEIGFPKVTVFSGTSSKVISWDSFLRQHASLRLRAQKIINSQPQIVGFSPTGLSNDGIRASSLAGNVGRNDGIETNDLCATIPCPSAIPTLLSREHTEEMLQFVLNQCISNTQFTISQMHDIKARGWNTFS